MDIIFKILFEHAQAQICCPAKRDMNFNIPLGIWESRGQIVVY